MSRLARDGTAEPVSRDQILRRERGLGNNNFPYSADHEQDRQPYPVIHTLETTVYVWPYIHTIIIGVFINALSRYYFCSFFFGLDFT